MGKLVTFWSPYKGKSKVTSSMCAIAAQLGMCYPELSIAISHTNSCDFSLEEKIDIRSGTTEEKMELYRRTGLSALKVNYRQTTMTSEKIRRSAILLRMRSLYLYPNTEKEPDKLSFLLLTGTLKEEYDLVFLDLESGRSEENKKYFAASDLVVIVMPQDPAAWEQFFHEEVEYPEEKNRCILIGGYMKTVKYGSSFFERKAELRHQKAGYGVIPLNHGYFDAMAEGRVLDFFYRNQHVRNKEENYEFIVQTKKAAEKIRKAVFAS